MLATSKVSLLTRFFHLSTYFFFFFAKLRRLNRLCLPLTLRICCQYLVLWFCTMFHSALLSGSQKIKIKSKNQKSICFFKFNTYNAACLTCRSSNFDHVTPLPYSLHWLPAEAEERKEEKEEKGKKKGLTDLKFCHCALNLRMILTLGVTISVLKVCAPSQQLRSSSHTSF